MDFNISIIVPVYNVESYLSDCLKSLQNQTYSNFEV
ncbi:glycosyltransferase, partial [Clostridium perfringens]